MKELQEIQERFRAPKDQYNEFGGFQFRNVERMLAVLKPLLSELECTLVFNDEVVCVGGKNYNKCTATLTNSEGESVSTTAFAREDEDRAGMCAPQMTGSAITYCRKYTLGGLLLADSGEADPDSMDNRSIGGKSRQEKTAPQNMGTRKPASKLEYVDEEDDEEEANRSVQELEEFCRIKVDSCPSNERKARNFYKYYKDKVAGKHIDLNLKWEQWQENYKPKYK